MKKFFVLLFIAAALTGCVTTDSVSRVDSDKQIDLSGYWNDTDVKIVAKSLISQCTSSARIAEFRKTESRLPVIIVGTFKNASDEHIDTAILTKKFEAEILNSGKADIVSSDSERGEIRQERMAQQSQASEATAKKLANETGADFILQGSVRTIIDSNGEDTVRTYFVSAEIVNIETNKKIWIGEDSSIKKVISRSPFRF